MTTIDFQRVIMAPSPLQTGRCACATCGVSQALRDLDAAHEAWLNQSAEAEQNLAFLIDEVRDVLASLPPEQFFRLSDALRVVAS